MSALQWSRTCDVTWVRKSTDGYYGISNTPGRPMYDAFHIEALWASPEKIGDASSMEQAQAICDQHRRRTPAPV